MVWFSRYGSLELGHFSLGHGFNLWSVLSRTTNTPIAPTFTALPIPLQPIPFFLCVLLISVPSVKTLLFKSSSSNQRFIQILFNRALYMPQALVQTVLVLQCFVGAALDDVAVIEHEDAVRVHDG